MKSVHPLHFGKPLPPPYAGIEAHIDMLLRALQPDIHGTLLACGDPADALRRQAEFPYRVIVERFYGRLASAPIAPAMLLAVQRELASGRSNLLHLHAPNPLGDLAGLAFGHDVPLVLSWHSDIVRQRSLLWLYGPIQRRIIDRADRIIVFTPGHYESSAQLRRPGVENKLHVIPMGFDLARLDASLADPLAIAQLDRFTDGRPMLLTVGRHIYYKGYEYLLAAFARVRADAVLVMIGSGPLTSSLKRQAVELGIESQVLFTGEVDHGTLVAAYHRCDAFALPSIEPSEAFGMASAEAMACGKPTVVCELGNGVNYLNRSGLTSLSVAPRDVAALSNAIETLLGEPALRQSLGENARQWVRTYFSSTAMATQTAALYHALV